MAIATPGTPAAGGAAGPAGAVQQQLLEIAPLVAIAARFAAHYEAAAIYLGLRIGPGAGELAAATEYTQIWSELLQMPCGLAELELIVPLLELEPWQVVDLGYQVSAPFDATWSCVGETAEPCGTCRGCRAREQAFQQAGRPDPQRSAAVARKS
jgi:7-cyano-7-deazaguanine synthase